MTYQEVGRERTSSQANRTFLIPQSFWLWSPLSQVFTRRGLEKNPTLDVKLSLEDRPELEYGARHPGLSAEEAGVVAGLLSRVRVFVTTAGLDVKVHRRCH